MDIAGDDSVRAAAQRLHTVAEEDFDLGAGVGDDAGIEIDIINAGEGVHRRAELLAELLKRQNVAVRVNARLVQLVPVDKAVAHLIRG